MDTRVDSRNGFRKFRPYLRNLVGYTPETGNGAPRRQDVYAAMLGRLRMMEPVFDARGTWEEWLICDRIQAIAITNQPGVDSGYAEFFNTLDMMVHIERRYSQLTGERDMTVADMPPEIPPTGSLFKDQPGYFRHFNLKKGTESKWFEMWAKNHRRTIPPAPAGALQQRV